MAETSSNTNSIATTARSARNKTVFKNEPLITKPPQQ
jgi:hypothetical protein